MPLRARRTVVFEKLKDTVVMVDAVKFHERQVGEHVEGLAEPQPQLLVFD